MSVLRANPKKNVNGMQLDPLMHKNGDTQFSMDLSESGNSIKMSPEHNNSKKNPKSIIFFIYLKSFIKIIKNSQIFNRHEGKIGSFTPNKTNI